MPITGKLGGGGRQSLRRMKGLSPGKQRPLAFSCVSDLTLFVRNSSVPMAHQLAQLSAYVTDVSGNPFQQWQ